MEDGFGGWVLRIAPMAKNKTPEAKALMKRYVLRPPRSTNMKMNEAVLTTFIIPYTPDASRELVAPR